MNLPRAAVPLAVLGGAIALAWRDERARNTTIVYREDGKLGDDWSLVPIVQRAAIASRAGWFEAARDQSKPRPVTSTVDASKVERYWLARLQRADERASAGTTGPDAVSTALRNGPRVSAFKGRIREVKRLQGLPGAPAWTDRFLPGGRSDAGDASWTTLVGPLNAPATIAFWRAIDSAATTTHAVLSQIGQDDVSAMFSEIGVNFVGTMADYLARSAESAADVAATVGAASIAAVLAHPLVLGAASLGLVIYFRGGAS
jgi:hypothetical protein